MSHREPLLSNFASFPKRESVVKVLITGSHTLHKNLEKVWILSLLACIAYGHIALCMSIGIKSSSRASHTECELSPINIELELS